VGVRLHIHLDDDLVDQLDARVGRRGRSAFITATIRRALDDQGRWDEIEAALGAIEDQGHEWDRDSAAWVRAQRRADTRRTG
jgi:Arc/MetJ-type ribon-helix-helix transcriptional regulator